ncbi:Prefoldin subunit-domain-containing protein [Venturia nashicola]|nr:Prefoldin subunit-domain-containing protein [Venturia nashicola]
MVSPRDGLDNLEKLRTSLEDNIQKLRKSLAHWQLWEAEYEGLKETFQALEDGSSPTDMLAAGVDMGGDIVNEKEIESLIWQSKDTSRSKPQILNYINGRIDTGQKNAATVRKQLHTTEDKLEQVMFVSQPAAQTEDGLPIMAITEELDDEDNIVSSNVKREDENLGADMDKYMALLQGKGKQSVVGKNSKASIVAPAAETKTTPASEMTRRPSVGKKVSFAQEPEINVIPPRESNVPDFSSNLETANSTRPSNLHPTKHMILLDDDYNAIGSEPLEIVDTSKLADEARENMNGIGAIVASMTIDNMTDDGEDDDDYDDDSEELDDIDWRTLDRAPIGADLADEGYRNYIEGLMKKHEAAFENVGPRHDESVLESLASSDSLPASNKSNRSKVDSNGEQSKAASGQKGVRFAEELDIQTAPAPAAIASTSVLSQSAQAPFSEDILERSAPKKPLVNSIVERTSSSQTSTNDPPQPKKVSRFKAARLGG